MAAETVTPNAPATSGKSASFVNLAAVADVVEINAAKFHIEFGSFRLASRVIAFGDFAAGLIELGLHFVGEFKLVFEKIINPRANFLNFSA